MGKYYNYIFIQMLTVFFFNVFGLIHRDSALDANYSVNSEEMWRAIENSKDVENLKIWELEKIHEENTIWSELW